MRLPARLIPYALVGVAVGGCSLFQRIPVVITTAPAHSGTLVWQEQESEERHTCALPCTVEIAVDKQYTIDVTADGYLPASVTLDYGMAEGTRLRQHGQLGREADLVIPVFPMSVR